jgi:CHASE2 domain-containing sensor protein
MFTDISDSLETGLLRGWFWLRGERAAPESVVLIEVDSRTKERLGLSEKDSIPRSAVSEFLERLAAYHPKAVIFDYVFQGEGPDRATDERLALALKNVPSVIGSVTLLDPERNPEDEKVNFRRTRKRSLRLFSESARYEVPVQLSVSGQFVKKISLVGDPTLPRVPLVRPLKELVDQSIEEPGEGDLINFYGGPFTLNGIPFFKFLQAEELPPTELLQDKVVLVGWTERSINALDPERRDSFLTPVSSQPLYGVEIHGTIAANLLDRTWLRRLSPEAEVLIAFWFMFFVSLAATRYSVRRAFPWILLCDALMFAAAYLAFSKFYYFIPFGTIGAASVPAFLMIGGIYESWSEARKREELQAAMGLLSDSDGE